MEHAMPAARRTTRYCLVALSLAALAACDTTNGNGAATNPANFFSADEMADRGKGCTWKFGCAGSLECVKLTGASEGSGFCAAQCAQVACVRTTETCLASTALVTSSGKTVDKAYCVPYSSIPSGVSAQTACGGTQAGTTNVTQSGPLSAAKGSE